MSDVYEFGACRLDVQRRVLTRDGAPVSLAPKTFELLLLLVQADRRALSKQELMTALWPDAFVDEANLSFQISALRKALGDGAAHWIETIPKYGYRFAGNPPIGKVAYRQRAWPWVVPMAVLVVMVAALLGVLLTRSTEEVKAKVPPTIPFTTDPGFEATPSFSPDGSQVAFAWSRESKPDYDIYVKLVGDGEPIQLTDDPGRDLNPAWSPDGRLIAFERSLKGGTVDLHVIPALGGGPDRTIATGLGIRMGSGPIGPNGNIAWTPDGKWLAHWAEDRRTDGDSGIWLFNIRNADKRQLTSDGGRPAFSADGRRMAYVRLVDSGVALYVLPLTSELTSAGPPTRVSPEAAFIRTVAWTPRGDGLIFSASGHSGVMRLYRVALGANHLDATGPPELLPFGENADSFTISSRTKSLVYSASLRNQTLLRLDLKKPDRPPVPVADSTYDEYNPDYSPDGRHIAFTSNRTGCEEIWIANADGSKPMQMTSVGGAVCSMSAPNCSNAHWSPDGRKILFQSTGRTTLRALWILDVATGRIEPLTDGPHPDLQPSWSRDGKTIYFLSIASGSGPSADRQIWRMPSDGGHRAQVTRNGGSYAIESVDGQYLYYAKVEGSGMAIWRVPVNGGEEVPVTSHLVGPMNFAVGRDGLYFIAGTGGPQQPPPSETMQWKTTIDFLEFKTGRRTTIARLDKGGSVGFALSPDERFLLYPVVDSFSRNLMLVEKIE